MIKIFFATFFLAELVIASAVILNIYRFNRQVNNWNRIVLASQNNLKTGLADFRLSLVRFNKDFLIIKQFIEQKRQEYLLRILKTGIVYSCIIFLKGRYKKSLLAYQLIREVYEGIKEAY
ncbi:MAG: hypothetical protein PHC64_04830 [Candidatus Gastranaerophilales bacterium]|nr:hypothetical protein [Candidatus Gastranaerophilales bacterium]